MPDTNNDKLVKDLNQIKQRQESVISRLEEIKQNADSEILPELEKIESGAWKTILEIDELKKNINLDLTAQIERNTILHRMSKPARRERIGGVFI